MDPIHLDFFHKFLAPPTKKCGITTQELQSRMIDSEIREAEQNGTAGSPLFPKWPNICQF